MYILFDFLYSFDGQLTTWQYQQPGMQIRHILYHRTGQHQEKLKKKAQQEDFPQMKHCHLSCTALRISNSSSLNSRYVIIKKFSIYIWKFI